MTLDESIEYFSTGAKKSAELCKLYKDVDEEYALMIKEDAERSAMVTEWLKELKAYREAEKEIEQELVNWDDIDNGKCRGLFLATSIIQHFRNKEVNADEDGN